MISCDRWHEIYQNPAVKGQHISTWKICKKRTKFQTAKSSFVDQKKMRFLYVINNSYFRPIQDKKKVSYMCPTSYEWSCIVVVGGAEESYK